MVYNRVMNAANLDLEMRKICQSLEGQRPRLLLHACCAPCSSACLERLKDFFNISLYFYNPNIEDEEYEKRKGELIRLASSTGWATVLPCPHDTNGFYKFIEGYEDCPEGGERCARCFKLRLYETARAASEGGFNYFCTTLTISPLKNAKLINEIGAAAGEKFGVKWLPCDFKKGDGYLRSIQLSKQYGLYRQNYCGCIFSKTLDKSGGE